MKTKSSSASTQRSIARADLAYRVLIGALALLAFCAQMAGWA